MAEDSNKDEKPGFLRKAFDALKGGSDKINEFRANQGKEGEIGFMAAGPFGMMLGGIIHRKSGSPVEKIPTEPETVKAMKLADVAALHLNSFKPAIEHDIAKVKALVTGGQDTNEVRAQSIPITNSVEKHPETKR